MIQIMPAAKKDKRLTGKQKRHLRSLGHHLKPLVMLGREGITDNVIKAAAAILEAHELLKVKIGHGCLLERQEAAEVIAARTGSEIVQVLGKTFLVFKANHERSDEHRIKLPV